MRRSPLYEVVGQLGMWGTLINGIQAAGLEHKDMTTASWNGATSAYLRHPQSGGTDTDTDTDPMNSWAARRVHGGDVHPVHGRADPVPHGVVRVL